MGGPTFEVRALLWEHRPLLEDLRQRRASLAAAGVMRNPPATFHRGTKVHHIKKLLAHPVGFEGELAELTASCDEVI